MRKILAGKDEAVARWVQQHCPLLELSTPYTALGLVDDADPARLLAGVVYDTFTGFSIETHVAAVGKPWTRVFLGEAFRYPFEQLHVARITARVAGSNHVSRAFVERLGFVQEGCVRRGTRSGEDLIIYGMLRRECRWLKAGVHG